MKSAIIGKYNTVRVVKRDFMYNIAYEKGVLVDERLCGESHLILNS